MKKESKPVSKWAHLYRYPLDAHDKREVYASFTANMVDPIMRKRGHVEHALSEEAYQFALKKLPRAVREEAAKCRESLEHAYNTFLCDGQAMKVNVMLSEDDKAAHQNRNFISWHFYPNRYGYRNYFGVRTATIAPGDPLYAKFLAFQVEGLAVEQQIKDTRAALSDGLRKHRYVGRFLDEYPFFEPYLPMKSIIANASAGKEVVAKPDADAIAAMLANLTAAGKSAPKKPRKS